jgi:tRNA-specific 2-thiouridylase
MAIQIQPKHRRPQIPQPAGRVVVGMSGGVDSSVAAALLKEAGFDVIGMTMQIWHRSSAGEAATVSAGCCTIDAVDDARRVARALDVPYYVPNFREPFTVVVDDFAKQYVAGRTPNPCVRCNQLVRFDGLIQKADEVGADYVSTGHYARILFDAGRDEYVLKRARDIAKDQSYVLHTLTQNHLSRLIMPLGDLIKSETRELAHEFGLPVASKPDSQEICFVAGGNYREFLEQVSGVKASPGPIIDRSGTVVGEHPGIHNFTVGQRKGLHLSGPDPSFVIELRPVDNAVVVGRREDALAQTMECEEVHLIGRLESPSFEAGVRIRSHAAEEPATVTVTGDCATVRFIDPVWGATPGQSAVFYDDDRVIGGGTISHTGE